MECLVGLLMICVGVPIVGAIIAKVIALGLVVIGAAIAFFFALCAISLFISIGAFIVGIPIGG